MMTDAYSCISSHVPKSKQYKAGYGDAVAFLTSQDANQNKFPHIKYRRCQKTGHYASNCKAMVAEGDKTNGKPTVAFVMSEMSKGSNTYSFTFSQANIGIPRTWIILNTGSTTNIFCNPALLTHIITVNETKGVKCNMGQGSTNKKGMLDGFDWVWFHAKGTANILSFAGV
eukprot:13761633-Ditylum_brightwellii.AAC.1